MRFPAICNVCPLGSFSRSIYANPHFHTNCSVVPLGSPATSWVAPELQWGESQSASQTSSYCLAPCYLTLALTLWWDLTILITRVSDEEVRRPLPSFQFNRNIYVAYKILLCLHFQESRFLWYSDACPPNL